LADIILASSDSYNNLRKEHEHNSTRRVEHFGWVEEAISTGYAVFTPPHLRRFPGPGSG